LFAPPDGVIGLRHGFWRAEHGAFALRWIDQTDAGVRVQVAETAAEAQQIDVFIGRTSLPYSLTSDLTIRDCYARVTGKSIDASISNDDGILYPVHSDGTLGWYRHLDRLDGSVVFANNGNEKILAHSGSRGGGWSAFKTVVAGGNGVLYAIKQDGALVWYRHLGWEDGSAVFANKGSEKTLTQGGSRGDGWSAFKTVVAGGNGVLYAIKQDGTLVWYRHLGWEDGSAVFANNGSEKALTQGGSRGDGWSAFKTVVAGGNGVLYAIKQDGTLVWYRHLGWEDGSAVFANNGSEKILAQSRNRGDGWSAFKTVTVNTAII
jgi:Tachylectin